MFGSQKSGKKMSVEEFVTGQCAGAPVDGGAAGEQRVAPKTNGWLVAAVIVAVGLLVLCVVAFAKIGHLSRDVALLKSQVGSEAVADLKAQVATLTRDIEAMKPTNARGARAKTKMPIKKVTADKKKAQPH
jgi:outer membrane murein-binding lipoprotein Lpp